MRDPFRNAEVTDHQLGADAERVSTDHLVSKRWRHTVDAPRFPYVVELVLALDDSVLVCEAVHVLRRPGGPEVTSEAIRDVPVARLIRKPATAGDRLVFANVVRTASGTTMDPVADPTARRAALGRVRRRRDVKAAVTPERLRTVAGIVRLAESEKRPTGAAVSSELHGSESWARRLIQRARDDLDPATGEPYLPRRQPSRKAPTRRSAAGKRTRTKGRR